MCLTPLRLGTARAGGRVFPSYLRAGSQQAQKRKAWPADESPLQCVVVAIPTIDKAREARGFLKLGCWMLCVL